jgi:superfamily II DNA/RNA helicase
LTRTFAGLGVPPELADALSSRGIRVPFAIQAATIPDALAGRDVCGRAPTGCGKTIAFGVPLLARVRRATPRRPTALVLAPTRELVAQITRELGSLGGPEGPRVLAVHGGVGYGHQRRMLDRGVEVVVACPGRLADLVGQHAVELASVEVVVVDEADRMADMGFLPEVRRLLDRTPRERQTLLFSATLDGAIDVLIRDYQQDPVRHDAGGAEPDGRGAHHVFWQVETDVGAETVARLLSVAAPSIVFCRTRRRADRLARQLERRGVRVSAIHGGRTQRQRDRALGDFAAGAVDALVATDVAARGIHVDHVACVVHFDLPDDERSYVHRSGRTARAGASGTVVSFVPHAERRSMSKMQRALDLSGGLTAPDVDVLAEILGPRVSRTRVSATPQAEPRRHRADSRSESRRGRGRSRRRSGSPRIREGRRG